MNSTEITHRLQNMVAVGALLFVLCFIAILAVGNSVLASSDVAQPRLRAGQTAGTTYYVNANTGNDENTGLSESEAFRTLNRAVKKTNPGDTVLVMNGTYVGAVSTTATLTINRSGTPEQWITYKAYPGHSPLIRSNGAFQAIRIEANYIIVDGFRVRGIRNQVSLAEAEEAYQAFKNGAGYNPRVHGTGIVLSHFNIVRNNEVFNFGGGGISAVETDSVIIENNLVYDNGHYSPFGHSGISVIYPEASNTPAQRIEESKYNIIVRGNISHSNYNLFECGCVNYTKVTDGNGIIIDDAQNYQGWTLVANNLVFNNGGSGIHAYKTRNVDIVNNTAYQNAQHPDIQGDIYARLSENVTLVNNIIVAKAGQRVTNPNGDGNDNSGNIVYTHNIYSDGTDSPLIPTELGDGDIIANPQFRTPSLNPNNADFRLSGDSPGLNSGLDSYLPMTDIRGSIRTAGLVDRGAYENNSAPPVSQPPIPQPSDGQGCGPLSQEAEDATLFGAMVVAVDGDASGGEHIHTPQGTDFGEMAGGDNRAEFCFTVSQSGTYRLLGAVHGVDSLSDTFFVQVNGQPSEGYLWYIAESPSYAEEPVRDGGRGAPEVLVNLSKGEHTVTISQREDGARLDTLRLELLETSADAEDNCVGLTREAEDAALSGAFVVGTSLSARGGQYIHAPEGSGSFTAEPVVGQQADFCFTVAESGEYFLRGGVYSNDLQSNSFFVQVDGEPNEPLTWNTHENTRYLTDHPTELDSLVPLTFTLESGEHQVTLYIREDGTRLDWLELMLLEDYISTEYDHKLLIEREPVVYLPAVSMPNFTQ